MICFALIFSFVFNARYYTNFQNAYSYALRSDTVYIATNGGIVYFPVDEIRFRESSFSINYKVFTSGEGLQSNIVLDIDFDTSGNLWAIVKDVGIQLKEREGEQFRDYKVPVVTLRKSKILKVFGNQYLLLGTDFGLFVIDTQNNTDENDDRIYPPLLVRDTVTYIHKGERVAYIVTPTKIYGWTPDSVYPLSLPIVEGRYGPIIETRDGLFYSTGNKLVLMENNSVTTFTISNVLGFSCVDDSIFISATGGLYLMFDRRITKIFSYPSALSIPTPNGILSTFYSINRAFTYYGPPWRFYHNGLVYQFRGPIPFNLISTLKVKKGIVVAGSLRWTTDTLSLPSRLYIVKDDTVYLGKGITINDNAVSSVDIDDSNKIWVGLFGTNSSGIYIFSSDGELIDSITDILPSRIVCHLEVGMDTTVALWLGGIYRIHKNGSFFTCEEVFRVDYPFSITQNPDGSYFIATENEGLIKIDRNGNVLLRLYPYDLNSSLVTVAKEREGKIYIGTPNGLLFYQNGRVTKLFDGCVRDVEFYKQYTLSLADSALLVIYGDKVLDLYTIENSPLTGMTEMYYFIRPVLEVTENGEVFAGGEQGLLKMKFLYPSTQAKTLRIFPNPCDKGANVYIETSGEPAVYDLTFSKIPVKIEKAGDLYFFDTSALNTGLYLIVSEGKQAKLLIR